MGWNSPRVRAFLTYQIFFLKTQIYFFHEKKFNTFDFVSNSQDTHCKQEKVKIHFPNLFMLKKCLKDQNRSE